MKGNLKYDFTGYTVLVTGASKGLGRATALTFARSGARVGCCARNEEALKDLQKEIESFGGVCHIQAADLSDSSQCLAAAASLENALGHVDILVNNAGISFPEILTDLDTDHWDKTLNVNLRAPALMSKALAPGMISRRKGAIINVSSNASLGGIEEHAAYCASKYGLEGLSKVMAVELGPHNIRVNTVAPTVILTPMGLEVWGDEEKAAPLKEKIPLGRFLETEEVTAAILFLASEEAAMIHGESLVLDGGVNACLY
ncbi:MAG: SDR family NAD(P)-dependent oxidoreductase [Spirochaetales bacterium]|nr:SDR family NAD(P)-dependent oxidoreductase [Spirochaetales bacterium]